MMNKFSTLFGLLALTQARGPLPDKVTAVWFANWAQYRGSPYTFTPESLGDIVDDVDIIYYGFAFFCPDSSMFQPYWVTDLGLCDGKQPFDVISIEPKDPEFYANISSMKTGDADFKFILSIGGWNFPSNFFSGMVSSETSRSTFISSVVSFIKQYNFDGIDIDWEYPNSAPRDDPVEIMCTEFHNVTDDGGSPSDKENFVSLMKEMRSEFDKSLGEDYIITFCGQAGLMNVDNGFDLPELVKYVDLINIMSYDYTVSDTDSMNYSMRTDGNEPLYAPKSVDDIAQWNVNSTLNGYIERGAPANQLLVGIAYYGHTWMIPDLGSNSDAYGMYGLKGELNGGNCCGPVRDTYGGPPGNYTLQCGTYGYYEIQNADCPYVYNNETETYIAYCDTASKDNYTPAGTWINYQGPDSIRAIMNFANGLKLRGAFGFDITLDSYSGGWTFELTQLMNNCVKKSSC